MSILKTMIRVRILVSDVETQLSKQKLKRIGHLGVFISDNNSLKLTYLKASVLACNAPLEAA